jgi:Ion channel
VSLLHELGYTNVRHYPGGLAEWASLEPSRSFDTLGVDLSPAEGRGAVPARVEKGNRSLQLIDALSDRTVGELFRLWIEVVLLCGAAYWLIDWLPGQALVTNGTPVRPNLWGLLSALYFSAVTATSVGYGDIVPAGAARLLAIAESVAGLIIFGCLVSKFVSRRQEQLIGEIHRIAFEDRLGRVRTNLHLVRTELLAAAALCEGHDIPPPAATARLESIAMIFVGELHAVHDLLYRPQLTPEEPVLEAILASLASVFREFNALMRCVHAERAERRLVLRASLEAMSRLAGEICGDCVPRQYAPALRTWMDQIQQAAREIA